MAEGGTGNYGMVEWWKIFMARKLCYASVLAGVRKDESSIHVGFSQTAKIVSVPAA
jgi:hypothetical protein